MGANNSQSSGRQEDQFALPEQKVVNLQGRRGVNPKDQKPAGKSVSAVPVKPPITLGRDGLKLSPGGDFEVDICASTGGIVEAIAPGIERPRAEGNAWPMAEVAESGARFTRVVGEGCHQVLFNKQGEALLEKDRKSSMKRELGEGARRWPLIIILRPGGGTTSATGSASDNPPDGTLMVCCVVNKAGTLEAAKQIIAWDGAAYVMKDLYGITEAHAEDPGGEDSSLDDSSKMCVISLTEPKDTALLPCGHYCVCNAIAQRLLREHKPCPLCRREVKDIVRIDVHHPMPDQAEQK